MRSAAAVLCRVGIDAPMFALRDMDEARPSVIRREQRGLHHSALELGGFT
jgi:hypothetical protein